VCGRLRDRTEGSPASVRDDAEFLYLFLGKPNRPIGFFDERDYFLGETALIAGTACRVLSRREEARRWFDRADASFRHTVNAVAEWSRVAYQRLALKMEERHTEEVLELAPALVTSFENLKMPEDALKCRFLEAVALKEGDRLDEAAELFRQICQDAERLGSEKLLAIASYNLVQIHGFLGQAEEAMAEARLSLPILKRLNNRVGIAKLHWGLGVLLRSQERLAESLDVFRVALNEFEEIGMRADAAAVRLVLADVLLELNRDSQAMLEVLAALPVIEEEKMVPEGAAALSLLRESVRHQRINREALRDLHGYFEELK
jgi:tetratricopeptide (TPR) repeat protein